MGFKVEKRKPEEPKVKTPAKPLHYVLALLCVLMIAWTVQQIVLPVYVDCSECGGTGAVSCGAPGCVGGMVRCPATCLKKDDPGWQPMAVEGHGPEELWMRFDNDDGGWEAWSQAHVGQLVEKIYGKWVNQGTCPTCSGSGRLPCPVCHAKMACTHCDHGKVRQWYLWYQGGAL